MRSDFTFRTKLFGDFPESEQYDHIKSVVNEHQYYTVECNITETGAEYAINGEPYAKCEYTPDTVPVVGHVGIAIY